MARGRSSSGGRGMSSSGRGMSSSGMGRRSFGGPVIIVGGTRYYSNNGNHSSSGSSKAGLLIATILLLLMAIGCTFATVSSFKSHNAYESVEAIAVDNTVISGWNYTTYTYVIDNVVYTNRSETGWEIPEKDNATVTIYYLKSNPNVITEEAPTSLTTCIVVLVISVALYGISAILIKQLLKRKPKEALAEVTEDGKAQGGTTITETKTPDPISYVVCPYCGTKYNKALTTCPNCGSGNKQ